MYVPTNTSTSGRIKHVWSDKLDVNFKSTVISSTNLTGLTNFLVLELSLLRSRGSERLIRG